MLEAAESFVEVASDTIAEYFDGKDAFEKVLDEVGGLKPPASWVDTPEEDIQYIADKIVPEVRGMRDALSDLKGALIRGEITLASDQEAELMEYLDEKIGDLNRDLKILTYFDNPQDINRGALEKVGGARAFYNDVLSREMEIGEFIKGVQKSLVK